MQENGKMQNFNINSKFKALNKLEEFKKQYSKSNLDYQKSLDKYQKDLDKYQKDLLKFKEQNASFQEKAQLNFNKWKEKASNVFNKSYTQTLSKPNMTLPKNTNTLNFSNKQASEISKRNYKDILFLADRKTQFQKLAKIINSFLKNNEIQ